MANTKVKFNLNNHIYVKLKPEGFLFWKERNDEVFKGTGLSINPIEYYTSKSDKEGFVKFQTW